MYPQSSYHPAYSNYNNRIILPPKIRNLRRNNQPIIARKIIHHHSLMLPQPNNYHYSTENLRSPVINSPNEFNDTSVNASNLMPQKLMAISNDVTSIIEYRQKNSQDDENQLKSMTDEEYKNILLNNVRKIVEEVKSKKAKSNLNADITKAINTQKPFKLLLLPTQVRGLTKTTQNRDYIMGQSKNSNKPEKQEDNSTKLKQILEKTAEGFKGPFGFFRPQILSPQKIDAAQTNKTQKIKEQTITTSTDDDDDDFDKTDDDEPEENDGNEKGILFNHLKGMAETQKQALKDGGIIIQRLKVRKGGIAIAGPGGVATAGSGGTAIVGPGGIALTHPKSLTIAGPGAKVLALPETYDLEKAILKAKGKSLLEEGRLVATGPAIYYHPENLENSESISEI